MMLLFQLMLIVSVGCAFAAGWTSKGLREQRKVEKMYKEGDMTVNDFAVKVTEKEGLKKQVNIAQVKEVLKVADGLVEGQLYKLIRSKTK